VIRMSMGQQNEVRRVDPSAIGGTHRISLQPGVGNDALPSWRRDDERRMAEPGDGKAGHGPDHIISEFAGSRVRGLAGSRARGFRLNLLEMSTAPFTFFRG